MDKKAVKDFWNEASCGEDLYLKDDDYEKHSEKRYELEPYILGFADFKSSKGKKVLEIGVGLGADHSNFAKNDAELYGVDLTERAISHTKNRLRLLNLNSTLQCADAENLPFDDNYFDVVYSWGVLHHSPDTEKAINEVYRVLKDDGIAKIMIYHKYSFVGYMLWFRYSLLTLRFHSLNYIYCHYLESSGTKAYTIDEANQLFSNFSDVTVDTVLTHGDLLDSDAGQRHKGLMYDIAKKIWPRLIIKKLFSKNGLFMLIKARK
jgi:ubiquinone/menaquinone biosynthesis C-methylase UbiE